jgi:hypothetical protein
MLTLNLSAQDKQDLHDILYRIKTEIENQGSVKVKNGVKSGWQISFKKCKCDYSKYQTFEKGTNYTRIDWKYRFNLTELGYVQYIEYDNHAIILTSVDNLETISAMQTKTYRDYNTTDERFEENSVYIDIRNKSEVENLIEDFKKAISICKEIN